jgi:signal transduction histidine kinase/class 3 adenylate cyclase
VVQAPHLLPGHSATEDYVQWREQFTAERLVILYYLGLVANPVFIAADVLLHRPYLPSLLAIRAVMELGLLLGLILVKVAIPLIRPHVLLVAWVLIGNLGIAQMTVVLGGFSSQYYNGLNLVFLAAAVIVPVSWRSHLTAQVVTLLYYYGANFLQSNGTVDMNAAIENSFFLVWTAVAVLFSVTLYERLQRAEFAARQSERNARQEVEASNRKLLELDRLKSEFFANISHELRTPLTLSLGSFNTLRQLAPTPECDKLIQTGLRNTSRLLFMINELLDLAKFESGQAQLTKRPLDLAMLVRNVAANFESSLKSRVHIKGGNQPVAVEADPRQLKKVLYNLLSNAFKFSEPEEGQVWIRLEERPDSVELEIADNGIGIPRDQLDRIFDRFTQVEGSATRRYEGTGIGLALVKEIVTLHEGQVEVESEMGHGSTFTIILPRGKATGQELAPSDDDDSVMIPVFQNIDKEPVAAVPAAVADGKRALVLVADDNPDMRDYLGRVLSREYTIAVAKDGAEALAQARAHPPHLILTDAMMPRLSGYDLLQAVRGDQALRGIPVIFLTARAGTDARVESFHAGADDYIAKPFDENELLARVGNLIRARAQEQELVTLQKQKMARFLPPHVADMITAGDKEDFLRGHRTEITVLFLDLRGFTAFAETASPEDLMGVLRQYQSEMGGLIRDYQGTLERFSGDAMMVFFNDPLPVENHADQAVRLSVAMRDRLADLRQQWEKRGFDLGGCTGLATGYATVGLVGFEERQDYAAIGPVTNLAARLCSEATHGQILISGRCLQLVQLLVHVQPVGELNLKGFHRPVSAYNVTGLQKQGV